MKVNASQKLQLRLEELVHSLPAGTRLPSEPRLAKELGVSRATLREAMRSLEGRGFIRRMQGVGTFINPQPFSLDGGLEVLESIETLSSRSGLSVKMGDLQVTQLQADVEMADKMIVGQGTHLLRLERIIQAAERPIAFLVDTLPSDVLTLEEVRSGFTGSVLDVLLQRGNPTLSHSRTAINAVPATPEVGRALQIQRGDVLLEFTAWLFDESGRIVDYSFSYFLPGYFRFHVMRRVG